MSKMKKLERPSIYTALLKLTQKQHFFTNIIFLIIEPLCIYGFLLIASIVDRFWSKKDDSKEQVQIIGGRQKERHKKQEELYYKG